MIGQTFTTHEERLLGAIFDGAPARFITVRAGGSAIHRAYNFEGVTHTICGRTIVAPADDAAITCKRCAAAR